MGTALKSQQKAIDMANQMSDYFRTLPEAEGVPGAVDHIMKFWTPKMRAGIVAHLDAGGAGLEPFAMQAVALLKRGVEKPLKPVAPYGDATEA